MLSVMVVFSGHTCLLLSDCSKLDFIATVKTVAILRSNRIKFNILANKR